MPPGFDAAGKVDVAQDDAAEDGAVSVGVLRQHRDANGGKAFRLAAHLKKGLFRRSWPIVVDGPCPEITRVSSSNVMSFRWIERMISS